VTRTVVVLAGGLGTRVAHLTGSSPKALLPIDGRPFLDFKLAELVAAGAEHIVVLVGHGAEEIRTRVEAQPCGASVTLVEDGPALLGTGGAVRRASDRLPERFWVTYGDTLLDVPLRQVEEWIVDRGLPAAMTVLHNRDQWETSNVSIESDRVVAYEKGSEPGTHDYLDYGALWLPAHAFSDEALPDAFDLGMVVERLVQAGDLGAWVVEHRFHDVGTEAAWQETDRWAKDSGQWARLQTAIGQLR
jgi:NDP-sugar pyrophosphorylase family protein